jgi:hypothetical chaperone protein
VSSHQGGAKSRGPVVGLGIDFGTTNSAAAVAYADGSTEVLSLDPLPLNSMSESQGAIQKRETASASGHDPRLFPTLLYFPGRTEAYFGSQAVSQYFDRDREGRFFQSIKRLLPNSEFQGTAIHGKFVSIEELIARFLTELRLRVERILGAPLGELPVVFGRPARYSAEPGAEGLAVVRFKKACELAGFYRPRFLEEPLAAAKIYLGDPALGDHSVLIADLGGGTSDFTLMEFSEAKGRVAPSQTVAHPNVTQAMATARILASHGISVAGDALDSAFFVAKLNPHFGTELRYQRPFSENVLTFPVAFARLLPKWHHHAFLKEKSVWNFLKQLRRELVDPNDCTALENLINLVEDNLGYALHAQVERLKKDLSQSEQARFVFKSYPIDLEFEVSRAEYEQMVAPSAQLIADAAIETLRQARVEPGSVARISFTGGTSRVPLVRKQILEKFINAREAEQDTFTSVAVGLAQEAAQNH